MRKRTRLILVLLLALPAAISLSPKAEAQNFGNLGGPGWACSLDNIAATLTRCAQNPDNSLYMMVTDIVAQSTTATAGQMLIEYGTGANCGTGTVALFPSSAAVVRFAYPPNTASPTIYQFLTPLKVPKGNDLCVLAVATNTLTIHMGGSFVQ